MASDGERLERNRQNAVAFLTRAFADKDPAGAAERYMAATYIQHHPGVPDGRDAFVEFATSMVRRFPDASLEIVRTVAEGDLVVLHAHMKLHPEDRGLAVADIFRFDGDGRIVEHWDVAQEIPEGDPVNSGML